jgi:glycosyltransferase involved in cell wall biosynthesis
MKVLVWQWGRFGSGPRFAFELKRALTEFCNYRTLLSLAEGAELLQSTACRRAVELPLRTYSGPMEFIWRSLGIRQVLRPALQQLASNRPDAAIVAMIGYWDVVFAQELRRMGVPVVCIAHDAEVHPGDRFHLALQLQRRMYRISQGIITLTNFVSLQLQSRVEVAEKVCATVPHPAFAFSDLELPPPRPPDAKVDRPLRLLLPGRLKRYKGLETLAEALKLAGPSDALSLRVVGAPERETDLKALRGLPRVEFDLGWKTDREIFAHLDWADATVLPYVEASQSGIVPLSFARARPVIATPVGGLPEQIRDGDTGVVTDSVSPEAFANAIRCYVKDRALLRRCGENALRFAQTELSWERLSPRYAEVLEAVVTRKRWSPQRA